MSAAPDELLRRYVEAHNAVIRAPGPRALDDLVALFPPRARITFHGVAFPPLIGRDAIAAAFAEHPPDDEIVLGPITVSRGLAHAPYRWKRRTRGAWDGAYELEPDAGTILRLEIRAEQLEAT